MWQRLSVAFKSAGVRSGERAGRCGPCSCCQHVWRASPHSRPSNGSCCGQQGCERYLGRGADAEKKTGFLTPFLTPKAAATARNLPAYLSRGLAGLRTPYNRNLTLFGCGSSTKDCDETVDASKDKNKQEKLELLVNSGSSSLGRKGESE